MTEAKELEFSESRTVPLWLDAWRRLRHNRIAIVGMVVLALLILVAIGAPWIAPSSGESDRPVRGG